MNAITIPDSLEERLERIRLLMLEAARTAAEEARLDEKRRMTRAALIKKFRAEGVPATLCSEMAMATEQYEAAANDHYLADLAAGAAKVEAEHAKLKWETWRTMAANKRAEMKL